MAKIYRLVFSDDNPETAEDLRDADRQTASLAAVAVTLLLLVIGLHIVHELHKTSEIEDCLMSGRTNCAPLDVPAKR